MAATRINPVNTRSMLLLLILALLVCCSAAQVSYAAEKAPDAVKPTDKTEAAPPTLTVILLDMDGNPISGIGLAVVTADTTGREKGRHTTDKDGKVVYTGLKSGSYYLFANVNALQRHEGYGMSAMVKVFKTSASYFISENRKLDMSQNAEWTVTIKNDAYITVQTFLQVVRSGKIVVINNEMGIQQIIPVASTDFLHIFLPMLHKYQIATIKDDDFDAWILEIFAYGREHIELL